MIDALKAQVTKRDNDMRQLQRTLKEAEIIMVIITNDSLFSMIGPLFLFELRVSKYLCHSVFYIVYMIVRPKLKRKV